MVTGGKVAAGAGVGVLRLSRYAVVSAGESRRI